MFQKNIMNAAEIKAQIPQKRHTDEKLSTIADTTFRIRTGMQLLTKRNTIAIINFLGFMSMPLPTPPHITISIRCYTFGTLKNLDF